MTSQTHNDQRQHSNAMDISSKTTSICQFNFLRSLKILLLLWQ